jgi:hypothetical protein
MTESFLQADWPYLTTTARPPDEDLNYEATHSGGPKVSQTCRSLRRSKALVYLWKKRSEHGGLMNLEISP